MRANYCTAELLTQRWPCSSARTFKTGPFRERSWGFWTEESAELTASILGETIPPDAYFYRSVIGLARNRTVSWDRPQARGPRP
jgi:hypothetical protein